MQGREIHYQISHSQSYLQNNDYNAGNWVTGITSDYRSFNPSTAKFASVATTRAGLFDPQRSFANFYGSGRFSSYAHHYGNSGNAITPNGNRLSYLAPAGSRPNAYYWNQNFQYTDPTKAAFANQTVQGTNFYRISDGNKVVMDQLKNYDVHFLYYNQTSLDNNLLTLSNSGAVSKIEGITHFQDNTTNSATPILFQTHGGIPENETTAWRTDYSRDTAWASDDRDTYIWYRPNFGSNVQLPTNVETMGEWWSNTTGERSGS